MKRTLRGMCVAILWMIASAHAATIPDQIDAILARPAVSGNTWTILFEDVDGHTIDYQKNPTTGLAPASNTKIFTSSAAFGLLGTNHDFVTRIYTSGSITGGALTGNLNLVSEHDMTWNDDVFSNPRAPLDYIAGQLKAKGLTAVNGNVQCYGVCFYNLGSTDTGHSPSSQGSYNASSATAFIAALQAQGITVSGSALGQTGFSPPGTLYYTYHSTSLTYGGKPLRLDVACIPMNKVSHNVMADMLLRHIGYIRTGTDSYAAGAAELVKWMQGTAGVSTNGIVMNDGSGLSHGNKFSARQTVSLTRYMVNTFPSWATTLPIGCTDGTIGSRFCGTDGSGRVHAKTGSLSISIALSGYLDNKHDSRRYFFSVIANNSSGIDQANTRDAIDDCVVLMCGRGEPISPQLLSVVNNGNGTITAKWSDEKFVRTGYRLYRSTDGVNYGSTVTLGSAVQSFTEGAVAPGTKRYYRVSVLGAGGESPPSRSYAAGGDTTKSKVLVVDGFDRWMFQPTDNPTATNHTFSALAAQSINGVAFDTANHTAVTNGTVSLGDYKAVIWMLGTESTADRTFDAVEQPLVTSYLAGGGNLFVNGAEVGWDLDRDNGPGAADRNFYHTQLRAALNGNVNDDAGAYSFVPAANGLFTGNSVGGFDNGTHGTYNVAFPDALTPSNGSTAAMSYSGGLGGTAAVIYAGAGSGGRVVNFGFPFETITSATVRDATMADVLRFFNVLPAPQMAPAVYSTAGNLLTLNWSSIPGLKYRVVYKNNLNDPGWLQLSSDVTAAGTVMSYTSAGLEAVGQRFYKVLLVN